MTDAAVAPAMTTATEPDGAPRVASLDILRGLAILAILFMNIPAMGGSLWAIFEDVRRYGWTGADQIAFVLQHVLAEGTARALLEMLFGVGMVILTDRAATAIAVSAEGGRMRRVARRLFGSWAVLRGYWWRNFVLFLFGLVHVFILLWPGDILHTYGLAALIAVLFRKLGPKSLLGIGLFFGVLQLTLGGYMGYIRPLQQKAAAAQVEARQAAGKTPTAEEGKLLKDRAESKAKRDKDDAEMKARIEAEDVARNPATGTFESWTKAQWDGFITLQSWGLEILFVWEALATMLIGAALYKWGVIQGRRSRGFYAVLTIACYAIGIGFRSIGAWNEIYDIEGPSITGPASEVARLAMTLGHVGVVHLMLGTVAGRALLKPFEAAGKTALSVYIAQTFIMLWVLYPPFMLGLYGTQSWAMWMVVALIVNIALLWGANLWVKRYQIAPVEWLWRSIIARRWLPFPRARGSLAGQAVPVTA